MVCAPPGEPAVQLHCLITASRTGVPWLEQAVLNDFIETGAFESTQEKFAKPIWHDATTWWRRFRSISDPSR